MMLTKDHELAHSGSDEINVNQVLVLEMPVQKESPQMVKKTSFLNRRLLYLVRCSCFTTKSAFQYNLMMYNFNTLEGVLKT